MQELGDFELKLAECGLQYPAPTWIKTVLGHWIKPRVQIKPIARHWSLSLQNIFKIFDNLLTNENKHPSWCWISRTEETLTPWLLFMPALTSPKYQLPDPKPALESPKKQFVDPRGVNQLGLTTRSLAGRETWSQIGSSASYSPFLIFSNNTASFSSSKGE